MMSIGSRQVSCYFDGDISPDDSKSLGTWLLQDANRVNQFVLASFVHSQLIELLSANQLRANALVQAESLPTLEVPKAAHRRSNRLFFLAPSIALLVLFSAQLFFRSAVVATVSGTRNVQWNTAADSRNVGSLLQADNVLAIDSGTLFVTFARGGQVALHGPCEFHADSDNGGELMRGSLSAFVPEHAVGFKIRCGKLDIVDLGTEFQVELVEDGATRLQVFDGLVELQYKVPKDGANKLLQISQGRAIRFDPASSGIESIDYEAEKRLGAPAWAR